MNNSEISILTAAPDVPEIKAALKSTDTSAYNIPLPMLLLKLPEFGVNVKCSPKIGLPLLLAILR